MKQPQKPRSIYLFCLLFGEPSINIHGLITARSRDKKRKKDRGKEEPKQQQQCVVDSTQPSYFFLPATVLALPLRVRALVCWFFFCGSFFVCGGRVWGDDEFFVCVKRAPHQRGRALPRRPHTHTHKQARQATLPPHTLHPSPPSPWCAARARAGP